MCTGLIFVPASDAQNKILSSLCKSPRADRDVLVAFSHGCRGQLECNCDRSPVEVYEVLHSRIHCTLRREPVMEASATLNDDTFPEKSVSSCVPRSGSFTNNFGYCTKLYALVSACQSGQSVTACVCKEKRPGVPRDEDKEASVGRRQLFQGYGTTMSLHLDRENRMLLQTQHCHIGHE
jgi:hypothetical protein